MNAPSFRLPGLYGEDMTLAALQSRRHPVLLIFADSDSAECADLLAEIADWQRADRLDLTIAVLASGSIAQLRDVTRSLGVANVYVLDDIALEEAFQIQRRPSAVLIDSTGVVAAPVIEGARQIRTLVQTRRETTVSSNESAVELLPAQPHDPLAIPEFAVRNLKGDVVTRSDLISSPKPVVMIFTDPQCGPCYEILPAIGGWQRVYGDRLATVVVSGGSADTNQAMIAEYGIRPGSVLLQTEYELFRAFGLEMAPAALVIGPDGRRVGEVVLGADVVRQLVADTLGLRLRTEDVAPVVSVGRGDRAPRFRRPDLDGRIVDIRDYQGAPLVLLFWSPGCSHCRELVPQIRAWAIERDDANLLVVSTGAVSLNREADLGATVILDDDRALARAFGTSGTPATVVIDDRGVIVSEVIPGATRARWLMTHRFSRVPVAMVS
jgi:peroxiredoxin